MTRRIAGRALAATATMVAVFGLAAPAFAAAPPADPNAKGYIGLCDRSGHQITSGNVNAAPFAWKAVASQLPPPMYHGTGQNAILNIYQLRPDTSSEDWSGDQLTAPSFYVDTPTTVATVKDESLATFVAAYPPMQDGLYQLRMFFAANGSPTYTTTYPALYIRVSGATWTAVGGGTVNCAARAQSFEVYDHVVSAKDSGGTDLGAITSRPKSGAAATSGPRVPADSSSSAAAPGISAAGTATHASPKKDSSSSVGVIVGVIVGVVVALVVVAGGGGYWYWLRRRPTA